MIRRIVASATGIAVVIGAGVALIGGVVGGSPMMLLLVAGIGTGAAVLLRSSRPSTEVGWAGATSVPTTEPATGPSGSAALALARVESRELVLSPAFAVGLGLCLVILGLFGIAVPEDVDQSWQLFINLLPMAAHPLVGLLIVAAHQAVTRARRHGCDELFESCPADTGTRLLGHLGTAGVAAAVALAFVVVFIALVTLGNDTLYGPTTADLLPTLALCAVLAAGGIALGTATGHWVRWGIAPFVAVVAVGVLGGQFAGGARWATKRTLATFELSDDVDFLFIEPRPLGRLVWIAALSVAVACLALLRLRRWALPALAAAAVVAIATALVVTRPMSTAQAALAADRIADPLAHSHCEQAGPDVKVCVYERYRDHAARVADELRPVATAVPDGVLEDVLALQLYSSPVELLPIEVERALAGREPGRPDGAIVVRLHSLKTNFEAARLRLAAKAVGAPTEQVDGLALPVAGEARGVVLLWLATRGMSTDDVDDLLRMDVDSHDPNFTPGMIWPGTCEGDPGAVIWAPQDVRAAQAITDLPDERVRSVIHDGWDRFTDPDTPTDDLLAALGLPSGGPVAHLAPAAYVC